MYWKTYERKSYFLAVEATAELQYVNRYGGGNTCIGEGEQGYVVDVLYVSSRVCM